MVWRRGKSCSKRRRRRLWSTSSWRRRRIIHQKCHAEELSSWITPLQLLSCQCKRRPRSSLLPRPPSYGSPARHWLPSAHLHLVARCLDNSGWCVATAVLRALSSCRSSDLVNVQLLSFCIFLLAFNIYWSEHCILNKCYQKKNYALPGPCSQSKFFSSLGKVSRTHCSVT